MKVKKKSYVYLVIVISLLILTASSISVVFNLARIVDLGHYQISDNDRIEYGTNSINVRYTIDLNFNGERDDYDAFFLIDFTSNNQEDVFGISSVNYEIWVNNENYVNEEKKFESPKEDHSISFSVTLNKNDNLTASGVSTLLVNINGEKQEIKSEFDIDYVMKVSTWEYLYQFEIGRIWLEIILVIFFFVLCFFLIRIINNIYFQKKQLLIEKLRSDSYFEFFKRESQKRRREEKH